MEKYINKPNLEGEFHQISATLYAKLARDVLKSISLCIFFMKSRENGNDNIRKTEFKVYRTEEFCL